jgi:hypothetical protein
MKGHRLKNTVLTHHHQKQEIEVNLALEVTTAVPDTCVPLM